MPGTTRSGGTGDGVRTRLLILDASVEVLREHGAAGYSVPKVAERVNLQQGTVTHYFPTRRSLLVETAQHVAERYRILVAAQMDGLPTDDARWAEGFLAWMFDDAIVPPTSEIFPELWSLARTDPDIAEAVAGIYSTAVEGLVRVLGHDPHADGCSELCATIWVASAVTEGMTAVHAARTPDDPVYRAARDAAIALLAPRLHAAHLAALDARAPDRVSA